MRHLRWLWLFSFVALISGCADGAGARRVAGRPISQKKAGSVGTQFLLEKTDITRSEIERLQRVLASVPANQLLEIQALEGGGRVFRYWDGYGKNWTREVSIRIERVENGETCVSIHAVRKQGAIFSSSTRRLPELERQLAKELYGPAGSREPFRTKHPELDC